VFYLRTGFLSVWIGLAVQLGTAEVRSDQPLSGCQWNGPSAEWVLARHLPAGEVTGPLGSEIVEFLHRYGPVSFISTATGDQSIRLEIGKGATIREALNQVIRQAPEYRYSVFHGKVVIYPKEAIYDKPVDIGPIKTMKRASAIFFVTRGLRENVNSLQALEMPTLRGASLEGVKSPSDDLIEVGGERSAVGHLLSLIQKRPSQSFRVLAMGVNHLELGIYWTKLIVKLEVRLPPMVKVGEMVDAVVTGTLGDGSVVSLVGSECGVSYATVAPAVMEIDELGHAVAHKEGVGRVVVRYEDTSAQAQIRIAR
jgi:hypothetical protein